MTPDDMDRWLTFLGPAFLSEVGMRNGQIVLDFGCKHGTYSIPAAILVGEDGLVYAIDKDQTALDALAIHAKNKELKNIVTIAATVPLQLSMSTESIDMILLYDVLHLVDHRSQLLKELHRVLKSHGILSVHPRHHKEEMNMTLNDVRDEIESLGFHFENRSSKILMHDDCLVKGNILNFRKR